MSQFQSQVQQSRESAQFQLRLPDDLKTRIQDAAQAAGRSLNSEIVLALTERYAATNAPREVDPSKRYTLEEAAKFIVDAILTGQNPTKTD